MSPSQSLYSGSIVFNINWQDERLKWDLTQLGFQFRHFRFAGVSRQVILKTDKSIQKKLLQYPQMKSGYPNWTSFISLAQVGVFIFQTKMRR